MALCRSSRRYAAAAFSLAREENCLDALLADMSALEALLGQSPELARFLRDRVLSRGARRSAMEDLFRSRVHPFTWRFLLFLEEKRRLDCLGDVCAALRDRYERQEGIRRALLTTAFPIEDGQVQAVSDRVREKTGGQVVVTAAVRPALLGGFCVQVDDVVYDLSIAGALREAKERMLRG